MIRLHELTQTPVQHLPKEIERAIIFDHMIPLNIARKQFGYPVYVGSCYRTVEHELSKGRSGKSMHTFEEAFLGKRGANDTAPFDRTPDHFLTWFELLHSVGFRRICFYPKKHFFHCDYKADFPQTTPQKFVDNSDDIGWQTIRKDQLKDVIREVLR